VLSRWPVLTEFPLDHTAYHDGAVRREVVLGWVDAVSDAYLDDCEVLRATCARDGLECRRRIERQPDIGLLGRPLAVVVSAGAVEVHPTSFTILVRVRPGGGETDQVCNVNAMVELVDARTGAVREIEDDVRDELIALAHAARHFN
jgi:hypothetical protein